MFFSCALYPFSVFGDVFTICGMLLAAEVGMTVMGCGTNGVYSIVGTLGERNVAPRLASGTRRLTGTSQILFPKRKRTNDAVGCLHRQRLSGMVGRLERPMLNVYVNRRLVYHRSRRDSASYLNVFSARILGFHPSHRRRGIPRVK